MTPDAPTRMPYPLPRREVRVVPTGRAAKVRRAILRERVVRMYRSGVSVAVTAAAVGVSEGFVYHALEAAEVLLRPRPLGVTRGRLGYVRTSAKESRAMTDYTGETRRFGGRTLTTERRVDGRWIAFLDGDRRRWEHGETEVAAIGALIISHGEKVSDVPR